MTKFYLEHADMPQIAFSIFYFFCACMYLIGDNMFFFSVTAQSPVLDPLQQAYTGMQHYTGEPLTVLNVFPIMP